MKQGHDELVRFIRRTFGAATIAILTIVAILVAFLIERSSARDTQAVDRLVGAAAILALATVFGALFVLRRRVSAQAQDLTIGTAALDLRNAQLIDQTDRMEHQQQLLERQAAELHDALTKLETQKTELEKANTGLAAQATSPNKRENSDVGPTS